MREIVRIRRQGKFYCTYEEDAYVLQVITGYKLCNGRIGFPVSAINKVESLLESYKVNYVIIDSDNEISRGKFSKNNYRKYLDE